MNPIHALLTSSLFLSAALSGQLEAQEPEHRPRDYIAHEWGTFTSMVDTRGIVLEGLHHEEEALPDFVHDLMKVEESGFTKQTKLPASYVTQKMETPVIYFYADQPLQCSVGVWFAQGLMTQFYPLPTTIYPRIAAARKQLVDLRKIKGSRLTWDIDILARGASTQQVREVDALDPWHFARQTSANLVRTRLPAKTKARPETEHYLFYRGLGRWQPDVELHQERDRPVQFRNGMRHEVPFCMALELGDRGGRFVTGEPINGGDTESFDLESAPWQEDRERFARRVGANVLRALVQQGLYIDEARAMVATWSRSWFQTNGTRIIYLLPTRVIDEVLPLTLDPKPKELVRVMVGRHEFITPRAQDTVEGALRQQSSQHPEQRQQGAATLQHLDRFLEPHLRNVAQNGSSAASKRAAAAMLASMTQ